MTTAGTGKLLMILLLVITQLMIVLDVLKKKTMTIVIVIVLTVCIGMKLLMTVFVLMKVNGLSIDGNVNIEIYKMIVLKTITIIVMNVIGQFLSKIAMLKAVNSA